MASGPPSEAVLPAAGAAPPPPPPPDVSDEQPMLDPERDDVASCVYTDGELSLLLTDVEDVLRQGAPCLHYAPATPRRPKRSEAPVEPPQRPMRTSPTMERASLGARAKHATLTSAPFLRQAS